MRLNAGQVMIDAMALVKGGLVLKKMDRVCVSMLVASIDDKHAKKTKCDTKVMIKQ